MWQCGHNADAKDHFLGFVEYAAKGIHFTANENHNHGPVWAIPSREEEIVEIVVAAWPVSLVAHEVRSHFEAVAMPSSITSVCERSNLRSPGNFSLALCAPLWQSQSTSRESQWWGFREYCLNTITRIAKMPEKIHCIATIASSKRCFGSSM